MDFIGWIIIIFIVLGLVEKFKPKRRKTRKKKSHRKPPKKEIEAAIKQLISEIKTSKDFQELDSHKDEAYDKMMFAETEREELEGEVHYKAYEDAIHRIEEMARDFDSGDEVTLHTSKDDLEELKEQANWVKIVEGYDPLPESFDTLVLL